MPCMFVLVQEDRIVGFITEGQDCFITGLPISFLVGDVPVQECKSKLPIHCV